MNEKKVLIEVSEDASLGGGIFGMQFGDENGRYAIPPVQPGFTRTIKATEDVASGSPSAFRFTVTDTPITPESSNG